MTSYGGLAPTSPSSSASAPSAEPDREVTTTITATAHLTLPSHPTPMTYDQLNPKSAANEFYGPIGTAIVLLTTPLITYGLWFACNETTGCMPPNRDAWRLLGNLIGDWPATNGQFFEMQSVGVYAGFFAYLVACWVLIPVERTEGTLLRDGRRNAYKLNGFHTLLLTLGLTLGIILQPNGVQLMTWPYDHWVPLMTISLGFALFQAAYFHAQSYWSGELLAQRGNSGKLIYDYFLGRPLNPTLPGLSQWDVKTFIEVRPGIIGWLLLNISCACEQYCRLGRVTDSMVLVLLFEGFYCFDSLWNESNILTQMDITTDGYGFMLAFGNLVWVPFTFGLQARYLAFHPVDLGLAKSAAIFAFVFIGGWIFRGSNSEKDAFRNGRDKKNLEYMETKRGTRLITSGWWGWSRHPNYFGDWIMALGWSLPTGFETPITYFYIAYFVVLLLHRQHRDDHACKEKYGADWDEYCRRVPYKIIKYVY